MFIIFQGKLINKPNRNDGSYRVNEIIVDFNIEQLEYSNLPASNLSFARPNTKQSSSIGLVNTPKNPMKTIPETPNVPQKDIGSKEPVRSINESEILNDNISEKMKTECQTTEIFLL